MTIQPTSQLDGNPRPRALADIGFNDLTQNDGATSSEDEKHSSPEGLAESDARTIVGISLGPEQKRLTASDTPAIEKTAAIADGGGFFGPDAYTSLEDVAEGATEQDEETGHVLEETNGHLGEDFARGRDRTPPPSSAARMPSPWRATPRVFPKDNDHRSALKGLQLHRSRSSSGPSLLDGWQKAFISSLPSLPKSLTFTSPFSTKKSSATQSASNSPQPMQMSFPTSNQPPAPRRRSHSIPERPTGSRLHSSSSNRTAVVRSRQDANQHQVDESTTLSRASTLRRAASDESLRIRSTLSRVSTLGDDSRFEDVKEQVNSRAKAIRDSLQDSNIRLPSFPSLTHLTLDSFRSDFSFPSNRANGVRRSLANILDKDSSSSDQGSGAALPSPTPSQTVQHARNVGNEKMGGPSTKSAALHPYFTKACSQMTGDLVILGGYRGSILRTSEPPHRQLWVPVKVGLNIRKVDMEVGLNVPEDDEKMESKIFASEMLSHIGPVDISRRLFRRLRACDNAKTGSLRIRDYGYDWRLDPLFLSQRLIMYLEGLPCNRPGTPQAERGATVIAHSLGGLITRHAINQRPDLFAGVIYAGTPSTCVNILGPLRNGDDVLLSSRVLTAQVNFSIRTSFALLPLDGKCFFNKDTGEEFPVDFFNPQTWINYRLSPCVARPLPPLEPPQVGMLDGIRSSLHTRLSSVSISKSSVNEGSTSTPSNPMTDGPSKGGDLEPSGMDHAPSSSVATAVSIPRDKAVAYLTTALARVKEFKTDLNFQPSLAATNRYPPAAVIYGKSIPTVYGAKVANRDAILHSDAYDNLAFASGDGVVLARAAMMPPGYTFARGGLVSSERGHITLLGDLEAVGRALNAVRAARGRGTGLGVGAHA